MKKDVLRYSIGSAFLTQLLKANLITEKEYSFIKNRLIEDFSTISNMDGWLAKISTLVCSKKQKRGHSFGQCRDN